MKEYIEDATKLGRTITIHPRKYLDCRAHRAFAQACQIAEKKDVQAIVVEFKSTKGIRDSGLSMLLMLSHNSDALQVKIRLENCNKK